MVVRRIIQIYVENANTNRNYRIANLEGDVVGHLVDEVNHLTGHQVRLVQHTTQLGDLTANL